VVYCAIYSFIFGFGTYYIYRLLREGPAGHLLLQVTPERPEFVEELEIGHAVHVPAGE
jgi:cytochrome bd ubiquinol oxidase subunit I